MSDLPQKKTTNPQQARRKQKPSICTFAMDGFGAFLVHYTKPNTLRMYNIQLKKNGK